MEIRVATDEDAAELAELHVVCWQEAYVGQLPQTYLDSLSVDTRIEVWRSLLSDEWTSDAFVAFDDAALVAFIVVDRSDDADAALTTASVNAIYARARAWGTGVGRELMERGLGKLRDRGYHDATLWVLETNDRARRFYEAGGWIVDGSRTDEIGGAPVSEVRYRISLSS